MDKLQFRLPVFEGPLDLLLHLIRKHKLNIHDIEISVLLRQYLDYLSQMESEELEITGEFLEMAARLVYIKTCSLLPHKQEEDALRTELTGQLLQWDAVKQAAAKLEAICVYGTTFSRQPAKLVGRQSYDARHSAYELVAAYRMAAVKLQRRLPPPKTAFSGIMERCIVSVSSRVIFVLRRLYRQKEVSYQELFQGDNHSEQVATFLAVLELIKSKRIKTSDDNTVLELIDRTDRRG